MWPVKRAAKVVMMMAALAVVAEVGLCAGSVWSSAVSLLLNLEAARQGRSMLFSDEQKLLFKGGKKGFVKNAKLDFMRC
jgi:hypothetical protein